jgi:hypothetical protein
MIFLSTCTPIKHHNETPFHGKHKPKMLQKQIQENLRNFQTSK